MSITLLNDKKNIKHLKPKVSQFDLYGETLEEMNSGERYLHGKTSMKRHS